VTAEPHEADVPVLTQVVEEMPAAPAPAIDDAASEELALQLERALLERLGPEVERVTARAVDKVRAELTVSVLRMVREAVAQALAASKRD
jgi:hypothetical protein